MSSPDKLTGEKATNAVNTDDFGGSSSRLDDLAGGNALSSSSVESTGGVMDHMGKDNIDGSSTVGLSISTGGALGHMDTSYAVHSAGLWWTDIGCTMRFYVHDCGG